MKHKTVTVVNDNRIAVMTFDDKENKVNTWNDDLSDGFLTAIEYLRDLVRENTVDGIIILSGKEKNFHAGADIRSIKESETRVEMYKRMEFFHAIMTKISKLPVPTLAAINGHALGGGLELALSCDYRIARAFEKTLLGLPEVGIGRLPSYGGSQRLPRLIGIKGVELMLTSGRLTAPEAYELGIVDKCISEEQDLLTEAKLFFHAILSNEITISRTKWNLDKIKDDLKPYKESYTLPSQKLLLELVEKSLPTSLYDGLESEKKYRWKLSEL